MSNQPINPDEVKQDAQGAELDLDSEAPLAPVCPMNPGDGECEACQ